MRARIIALLVVALVAGSQLAAGAASEPNRDLGFTPLRVTVTTFAQAEQLADSGLDIVEHGEGFAEVWLYGPDDRATLKRLNLPYRELDYAAQAAEMERTREAEDALQLAVDAGEAAPSPLPSGRVAYRTLAEINADLFRLAETYPDRVELFELPNKTLLGTTVYGVEISHDVAVDSGKPVFLTSGVHH